MATNASAEVGECHAPPARAHLPLRRLRSPDFDCLVPGMAPHRCLGFLLGRGVVAGRPLAGELTSLPALAQSWCRSRHCHSRRCRWSRCGSAARRWWPWHSPSPGAVASCTGTSWLVPSAPMPPSMVSATPDLPAPPHATSNSEHLLDPPLHAAINAECPPPDPTHSASNGGGPPPTPLPPAIVSTPLRAPTPLSMVITTSAEYPVPHSWAPSHWVLVNGLSPELPHHQQ